MADLSHRTLLKGPYIPLATEMVTRTLGSISRGDIN